jgi:hypothetical protein
MAKGPAKYPHPKIFGVASYADWLKKAHREFVRFNASTEQLERIDHIFNFASSIANTMEWAFDRDVSGQPGWSNIVDLGKFRAWLQSHCTAVGKIETVNMAAKHTILHRHVPQIDAGSASVTGSFSMNLGEPVSFTFEGATIQDIQTLVVGDVIEAEVRYSVENLYKDGTKTRFYRAAKDALLFWDQFDPIKGETQTFVV